MATAIIAITRNGARLACRLAAGLPDSRLFVLRKFHGAAGKTAISFDDLRGLITELWKQRNNLVCIMAAGIVVRMIAPLLETKDRDPAVVTLDDAGIFSISLLSGHLGGANELAEQCARLVGARPVITTATDLHKLPSFDMLAGKHRWVIEDISRIKTLNALLLDGQAIAVVDATGTLQTALHGVDNISFYATFNEAVNSRSAGLLFVTNRQLPRQISPDNLLVLRPRNLVLGIGCNSGTPADEIEAFVSQQLKRILLSLRSVGCVATATAKQHEPGLVAFAERLGLTLTCFESAELNAVKVPSPPSHYALAAIGATGVAEPAALLASGSEHLLLKKVKSENVTLAVAEINEQGSTGVRQQDC